MKLVYWYAEHLTDSNCYSIVARTKKEATAQVASRFMECGSFGPVERCEVEYSSGFDLFEMATNEGGGRGLGRSYD